MKQPISFLSAVPPEDGPQIVAIGGGHGLANMLRGLKTYTPNLTAIVTVADDGGGSGMLRQDLGMPAPGDIRMCMQALSNTEPLMAQLLNYRFTDGSLTGQSFGNLLLAALNGILPSFEEAVTSMQQVLAITGRVLPVTTADVRLEALFENGSRILGESKICQFKKEQDCRIQQIRLVPNSPPVLPAAAEAIEQADLILLGPGSLYTSIIPNLLVNDVADAIRRSKAMKFYICNIMTQNGETEEYTAGDHLAALTAHGGSGLVNYCLANSSPIPLDLLKKYRSQDSEPVALDRQRVESMRIRLIERPLLTPSCEQARHSPELLTAAIREIYESCSIRVFPSGKDTQYILESN